MLTKHVLSKISSQHFYEPAPCNHCNEKHVLSQQIHVPCRQCSHCIITECMLIDVCFVMYVMQEPQGEQCCALMGYSWVNLSPFFFHLGGSSTSVGRP